MQRELREWPITPSEYLNLLKNDFVTFLTRCFYELNPHETLLLARYIECIASALEDCRAGKIKRLIINLPPRHLKSICVTVAFSAWLLAHNPSAQIIAASYGQELSEKMARDTKTILTSKWFQRLFPTRLSPDRHAAYDFTTVQKGARLSTSIGGVLTGRGADFIILDDPLKPDDAMSEARRKNTNEWFDNSLISRLNDKKSGCIIIIMQRLHQNDLIGHVLDKDEWTQLSLPAIAEQDEIHSFENIFGKQKFIRNAGEVLHPEREDAATIAKIRKNMTEYNFQSQYQQNPTPREGNLVQRKWLKFYKLDDLPNKFDKVIQSWDTAIKVTELSDFSVGTTWGKKGHNYYLLNVFRRRLIYPELKRAVREQSNLFDADIILIEDKASGSQLIQELKYEYLKGITAFEPGGTDKIMRLVSQTGAIENGQVHLPVEAHWLNDYINELISFPGGKYDDQVDSTAQALEWLQRRKPRGFFDMD